MRSSVHFSYTSLLNLRPLKLDLPSAANHNRPAVMLLLLMSHATNTAKTSINFPKCVLDFDDATADAAAVGIVDGTGWAERVLPGGCHLRTLPEGVEGCPQFLTLPGCCCCGVADEGVASWS